MLCMCGLYESQNSDSSPVQLYLTGLYNRERLLRGTNLLTPWIRVFLEKLTGFATSQVIPRIYGTRKFITVLTSARDRKSVV
jgi:hypothetical protein